MKTAYYSIIKFVPDLFRKEFINIGAIVIIPEANSFIFKIADVDDRVKRFFPSVRSDDIKVFENYLKEVSKSKTLGLLDSESMEMKNVSVASKEMLEELYRTNTGSKVQLSGINWVDFDSDNIEDETIKTYLNDLIKNYVLPNKVRTIQEKTSFLKRNVKEELTKRKLLGKPGEIKNHKVIYNYRTTTFDWSYDFALQNRKLHLIDTLELSKKSIVSQTNAIKEAALTFMKFSGANLKWKGKNLNNITLLDAAPEKEKELKKELDLIRGVSEIYSFRSKTEKKRFFDMIEEAAGQKKIIDI